MSITVHLDQGTANELAEIAGFTPCVEPGKKTYKGKLPDTVSWTRPGCNSRADGGIFGVDYLWELDEVVTEALEYIRVQHNAR